MEKMVVVVFETENKAAEGRAALADLENEGSIAVFADVVVVKNADGTATVKHGNEKVPLGTPFGTAIGSLIGALGGPAGLAIGASAGFLVGMVSDLTDSGIGVDFIEDVIREVTPGKFALLADIDEMWTTPLDLRMEALGGKVFRRSISEVKHTLREEHLAAMKADLEELKAEAATAQADRKTKLMEKINQLDTKIQTTLQHNKEKRQAAEQEAKAKAEVRKAKVAGLKAGAAAMHV